MRLGHGMLRIGRVGGGLNPQQALDAPRVCIGAGMADVGDVYDRTVFVVVGMPDETVWGLRELGHRVEVRGGWGGKGRQMFGRGQVIRWTVDGVEGTGVWSAGSDMRGDGGAYPA
jgi:gamma-glutamyltranspeptidase/glutathione hydrolase